MTTVRITIVEKGTNNAACLGYDETLQLDDIDASDHDMLVLKRDKEYQLECDLGERAENYDVVVERSGWCE